MKNLKISSEINRVNPFIQNSKYSIDCFSNYSLCTPYSCYSTSTCPQRIYSKSQKYSVSLQHELSQKIVSRLYKKMRRLQNDSYEGNNHCKGCLLNCKQCTITIKQDNLKQILQQKQSCDIIKNQYEMIKDKKVKDISQRSRKNNKEIQQKKEIEIKKIFTLNQDYQNYQQIYIQRKRPKKAQITKQPLKFIQKSKLQDSISKQINNVEFENLQKYPNTIKNKGVLFHKISINQI